MRKRFLPLLLCFLFIYVGIGLAQPPSDLPRLGRIYGSDIYSTNLSPIMYVRVTGNVSGATQFAASKYSGAFRDDFFNYSADIYWLTSTNITNPKLVTITDYTSAGGIFTTSDAGANYAVGDIGYILIGGMGTNLEGYDKLIYTGTVTTASATVPASTDWIGLPDDLFNEKYYCEVTTDVTPLTAPQSEIRRITDFVGSTGTITVSPAFSATTTLLDRLTIFHESVIKDRLHGQLQYTGVVSLRLSASDGIAPTSAADSCFVDELKGYGNDYFNRSDYFLKVVYTADGNAPIGEILKVKDYVSATGLFTFGVADGHGLSADLDDNDRVAIIDASIAHSDRSIINGEPFLHVGSSSATLIFATEIIGLGDTPHGAAWLKGGRYFVKCLFTGDGASPEGECRAITAINTGTGQITCDAFGDVVANGEIMVLVSEEIGSLGHQVTPAADGAPTAIDNQMAYLKQLVNDLEGTVGIVDWMAGTVGLQWADGVSIAEALAMNQDLADSAEVRLYGASGIAVFPASEAPSHGVPYAAVIRENYDNIVAAELIVNANQDSLQSTARVQLRYFPATVDLADGDTGSDTAYFAQITGADVVIARIVITVTTPGVAGQDMQLVADGYGFTNVKTSMSADYDMDTPELGGRVHFDLSNFDNAPALIAGGVPFPASDIFEEACEVGITTNLGFEIGESPSTPAVFDVVIWYYTNGTGIIAAP